MANASFSVWPYVPKLYIVLSCCEMFVAWLQPVAFVVVVFVFPPVAHSVCLLLEVRSSWCCLLGGSHMPHTEQSLFLWAVFELRTPGHGETVNSSLSYTAASTIKAESTCPFVVCGRVRLHSFHLFSKWLCLRQMKWGVEVNAAIVSLRTISTLCYC